MHFSTDTKRVLIVLIDLPTMQQLIGLFFAIIDSRSTEGINKFSEGRSKSVLVNHQDVAIINTSGILLQLNQYDTSVS